MKEFNVRENTADDFQAKAMLPATMTPLPAATRQRPEGVAQKVN